MYMAAKVRTSPDFSHHYPLEWTKLDQRKTLPDKTNACRCIKDLA